MNEQLDIAAIKARVEAATPGEWFFDSQTVCTGEIYDGDTLVETITIDYADRHGDVYFKEAADAEFVAHARQDVPLLIAEVERLREEVERAKSVYVDIAVLQDSHERLEDENERLNAFEKQAVYALEENRKLREVLRFYAERSNYASKLDATARGGYRAPIASDRGAKARAALGND